MKKPLEIRFWSKVNKDGPTHPVHGQCWEWTASTDRDGYGSIKIDRKTLRTNRTAWFLETGQWTVSQVLHKCDNRLCVNPAHLFEGSTQDNTADKMAKGRHKVDPRRGEESGKAKLTAINVIAILEEYSAGHRMKELAIKYNIVPGTIYAILDGKSWSHVTGLEKYVKAG